MWCVHFITLDAYLAIILHCASRSATDVSLHCDLLKICSIYILEISANGKRICVLNYLSIKQKSLGRIFNKSEIILWLLYFFGETFFLFRNLLSYLSRQMELISARRTFYFKLSALYFIQIPFQSRKWWRFH